VLRCGAPLLCYWMGQAAVGPGILGTEEGREGGRKESEKIIKAAGTPFLPSLPPSLPPTLTCRQSKYKHTPVI